MTTHIISIFDKNHMARAIACRSSLAYHSPESPVYWLCLDQESYEMAQKLSIKGTVAMTPEDLGDAELMASRKTRTSPEFASTCKPAFLRHMLKSGRIGQDDLLVFMDPDFYFYRSAKDLFKRVRDSGSITITPHRFPPDRNDEIYKKGVYNAGIVFFKNDAEAMKCLEEWRQQCIEWCYLRYENGQIGDQGYMSEWPKKYKGVVELPDKGVNLSTWNIDNYAITADDDGGFNVDGEPLICYHFHGLKIYLDRHSKLRAYPISILDRNIYEPCLAALQKAYDSLRSLEPSWDYGTAQRLSLARALKQKIKMMLSR